MKSGIVILLRRERAKRDHLRLLPNDLSIVYPPARPFKNPRRLSHFPAARLSVTSRASVR